jgi:hypothetical protein
VVHFMLTTEVKETCISRLAIFELCSQPWDSTPRIKLKELAEAVIFPTCIRGVPSWNVKWDTGYPEIFRRCVVRATDNVVK